MDSSRLGLLPGCSCHKPAADPGFLRMCIGDVTGDVSFQIAGSMPVVCPGPLMRQPAVGVPTLRRKLAGHVAQVDLHLRPWKGRLLDSLLPFIAIDKLCFALNIGVGDVLVECHEASVSPHHFLLSKQDVGLGIVHPTAAPAAGVVIIPLLPTERKACAAVSICQRVHLLAKYYFLARLTKALEHERR